MSKLLAFAPFVLLLLTACVEDIFFPDKPSLPPVLNIDLDDDGTDDYVISTAEYAYEGFDNTGSGFSRRITSPRGGERNFVLEAEFTADSKSIVLEAGTILTATAPPGLTWSTFAPELLLIESQGDPDRWPRRWSYGPNFASSSRFIYVGLMLASENGETPRLGWVRLKVDIGTGSVSLQGKGIGTGSVTVGR